MCRTVWRRAQPNTFRAPHSHSHAGRHFTIFRLSTRQCCSTELYVHSGAHIGARNCAQTTKVPHSTHRHSLETRARCSVRVVQPIVAPDPSTVPLTYSGRSSTSLPHHPSRSSFDTQSKHKCATGAQQPIGFDVVYCVAGRRSCTAPGQCRWGILQQELCACFMWCGMCVCGSDRPALALRQRTAQHLGHLQCGIGEAG